MKIKATKKPIEVECEQYIEHGKVVEGMCNSAICFAKGNGKPHVHTIHDNQIVNLEVGDYVMPEPNGVNYYPIKPDIFAATYDIN